MKFIKTLFLCFAAYAMASQAIANAKYSSIVLDARSGEVLYEEAPNTRLHPAGLTKLMTLYIIFGAVENGEVGLDDKVSISRHAASEPPVQTRFATQSNSQAKIFDQSCCGSWFK